jgi:hypothetical protein
MTTINIREYENSEETPVSERYPRTPWMREVTNGEKYNPAFGIAEDDQESADIHLWMLVGHRLRYDPGNHLLTWREAFEREREALAWIALAKDIGDWALYYEQDGKRVERTTHRDHVLRLFGARLPERVAGRQDVDILERVHIKREKSAKQKGESYWRKGPQPQVEQPKQETLFEDYGKDGRQVPTGSTLTAETDRKFLQAPPKSGA